MILDCRQEQTYYLEYIDYSGIINLAKDLEIENFETTLGEKTCKTPLL